MWRRGLCSPPGVVAVNVELGVARDGGAVREKAVDGDRVLRELAHEALLAQVGLAPPAHVVALRAADEACSCAPAALGARAWG